MYEYNDQIQYMEHNTFNYMYIKRIILTQDTLDTLFNTLNMKCLSYLYENNLIIHHFKSETSIQLE
mgnify:CR=1 FL=1